MKNLVDKLTYGEYNDHRATKCSKQCKQMSSTKLISLLIQVKCLFS